MALALGLSKQAQSVLLASIKDTLSTSELLRRKNMDLDYYNCVLCYLGTDEGLLHLFLPLCHAMLGLFIYRRATWLIP
jgi:hypothetical protein